MNDHDRIRWARALVFTGWMFVLAYLGILVVQIRRAALTTQSSFEDGIWGTRIEQISFATIAQNSVVLVPAAAAAVVGSLLVRSLVDPVVVSLSRLTRLVAGVGFVVVALAVIGVVAVFFRNFDSIGDTAEIINRLGGIAVAAAVVRLCWEADQET